MAEAVLARWLWDTTNPASPFWTAPLAGAVGSLDLRSIPQMSLAGGAPPGWGVFVYPAPVAIAGALALGNNLDANLSNASKTTIRTWLNLLSALTSNTLRDVLREILTDKADPTGLLRCKPLMPTLGGRLELHLGGFSLIQSEAFDPGHPHWPQVLAVLQNDYRRARAEYQALGLPDVPLKLLGGWMRQFGLSEHRVFIPPDLPDEGWLPPSTTIGDTFTDVAGTDLVNHTASGPNGGFAWAITLSSFAPDMEIHSTGATLTVADIGGYTRSRAQSDLASSNHYSQAAITTSVVGSDGGVTARSATAADTCYTYERKDSGTPWHRLAKVVAGVITELSTGNLNAPANGDTQRLEVNGSSLTGLINAVTRIGPFTDTSISSGTRAGLTARANGVERVTWDNFEAADLATGGGGFPTQMFNVRHRGHGLSRRR